MNLSDINSGPVSEKRWLNPQVGTLTANIITTDTLNARVFKINELVSEGKVQTLSVSGGTITIQPDDLISGVIGLIISGTGTVNVNLGLPTAVSLDFALATQTPPFYFTTIITVEFNVAITQGNINILVAGRDIATYNSTDPFTYVAYQNTPNPNQNKFQRTLIFSRSVSGWTLYA